MQIPAHLREFWLAFGRSFGATSDPPLEDVFAFGDDPALANHLADLVLAGRKRATAGALWSYKAEGLEPPTPGALSIITRWDGTPACVIEAVDVQVVPFNLVSAEFAAAEGDGDGSLAQWRSTHQAFFERECRAADRQFDEQMPVVCVCFRVVYRSS